MIDPDTAWAAFARRDRTADGCFVVGVVSTGIYCKPSCPARRPHRRHVAFYTDGAAARAAGLRACLRCRPDEAARDALAVERATQLLDAADAPVPLAELAAAAGYAPHHFHRLFRRATGVTPAAYARALRRERAAAALAGGGGVADAIYAAGYNAPSRFYQEAGAMGMTPQQRARGGAGMTIRWTIVATDLGPLLVAATGRGLCRVAFDEDEAALRRRFPAAAIEAGDAALADLAAALVAQVERPDPAAPPLPVDVRGTAFQEAVWQALRTIPSGETRSYAELAALAGRPGASRAAGSACGANAVMLAIPCHRVMRGDGAVGGYAHGPDRKRALLDREAATIAPPPSHAHG